MVKQTREVEEKLSLGIESWHSAVPEAKISLEELREKAARLTPQEHQAIEKEIADLFPAPASLALTKKAAKPWRKLAAGLVAASFLLMLAPAAVRSAIDLPMLGVYIQQFAMRHVGLEWAFENGYMQGTVAQVSRNGVTMKVLGVVADPVETTVIYLLQGVDEAAIKENGAPVHITIVDGQGAASWTSSPIATSVGFVGTVHTRALPNPTGTLNLEVTLARAEKMGLSIAVSREEISKLAQEIQLSASQTIEGITVSSRRAVLTPTQLMIEYSVSGGHNVWGSPAPEMMIYLLADGVSYNQASGSGGSLDPETNTWHLQAVFPRPASLNAVQLVIPALSKTVDATFAWDLSNTSSTATSNGTSVEIYRISTETIEGQRFLRFWYTPSTVAWAPREFAVLYQDGSAELVEHPRQYWSGDEASHSAGFGIPLKGYKIPVTLRANKLQIVVMGDWSIPLPIASK